MGTSRAVLPRGLVSSFRKVFCCMGDGQVCGMFWRSPLSWLEDLEFNKYGGFSTGRRAGPQKPHRSLGCAAHLGPGGDVHALWTNTSYDPAVSPAGHTPRRGITASGGDSNRRKNR